MNKPAKDGLLRATLKATVVKPVDGDWKHLHRVLWALRTPLHRVMNNAITRLELAKAAGCKIPYRTQIYQYTRECWKEERAGAIARVAAGEAWNGDDAIAEVAPHSSVILGVAGSIYTHWSKWNKERFRGDMSMPSFKKEPPICIASSSDAVQLTAGADGSTVLTANLALGYPARLIVSVDGGSAHATLRYLLENPDRTCDVKLLEGRKHRVMLEDGRVVRRRSWEIRLSYKRAPREIKGARTMALHRGMACFLTAAVARSEDTIKDGFTTILEFGKDILAHKLAYHARRRSLGQQGGQLGAGAKGHGKARHQERVDRLQDAEQRYVRSKCREVAAHAIRCGERFGVNTILVEDWSNQEDATEWFVRQWPWGELLECIKWAAARAGMTVESRSTDSNSYTCPICKADGVVKDGVFLCGNCRLERQKDVIFAWNMLRRDGHMAPLAENTAENAKAVKSVAKCELNPHKKVSRTRRGQRDGAKSKT